MRFTSISAAALAFAASAFAQTEGFDAMSTPAKDEYLTAGTTYSITWAPGSYTGSVTLSLLGGATPSTLNILGDLATVDNSVGSYSWAIDSSLGSLTTYGIKITLGSDTTIFQYSFPFHINGASSSSSSSVVSVASTGATSGYPVSTYSTSPTTKSVILSSAYSTTAPLATGFTSAYSVSPAPSGNLSSTAHGSTTAVPTTIVSSTTTSASSSQTSKVVVNGAERAAAGSVALLGAIAAAVFAL